MEGRRGAAPIRGFDASAPSATRSPHSCPPPTRGSRPRARRGSTRPTGAFSTSAPAAPTTTRTSASWPATRSAFFAALPVVDSAPAALAAAIAASRDAAGALDLGAFFASGFRAIHPLWPLEMLNNVSLGQIAADLDVRGDNSVFAAEADAGARALAEALGAIRRGEAAAALAVGVAEHVSPGALARAARRAVPGEVLGEGAGALALEGEAAAAARGRVPIGFLAGAGFAFDRSAFGPGPSSDAIVRAVHGALEDAGRTAADVALLRRRGDGRRGGDGAARAVRRAGHVARRVRPRHGARPPALGRGRRRRGAGGSHAGGRARPLDGPRPAAHAAAGRRRDRARIGERRTGLGRRARGRAMRFLLFDRVTSLDPGRRIATVKTFSMQDEHLTGHFPRRALVPGTMVLEAMLQSLGWLVMRTHEFRVLPFFSMLEDLVRARRSCARACSSRSPANWSRRTRRGRWGAPRPGSRAASWRRSGRVIYGHHPAPDPEEARRRFACYGDLA